MILQRTAQKPANLQAFFSSSRMFRKIPAIMQLFLKIYPIQDKFSPNSCIFSRILWF